MDNASDYESGDCRFESCQNRIFLNILLFYSFKNNLWTASYKLHSFDQCNIDIDAPFSNSYITVDFDSKMGKALIKNLKIPKSGMFMFLVSAKSDDYDLICFTKAILSVKVDSRALVLRNNDMRPNFKLEFANYDSYSYLTHTLEMFKAQVYNCLIEKNKLLLTRNLAAYKWNGDMLINSGISGIPSDVLKLTNDLKGGFTLSNGTIILKSADVLGIKAYIANEENPGNYKVGF